MDYKLINKALLNIYNLRRGIEFPKITSELIDNLKGEERQGESNEIIEIYSLGVDNIHIKITLETDSYGDNESITSIQFVKPVVKQVTDFEII